MPRKSKSRFQKKLELKLGLWSLRAFRSLYSFLPLKVAVRIGAAMGAFIYRGSKKYRNVAIRNLQNAFPDWNQQQCEQTAKRVFMNFGRSISEFLKTSTLENEQINQLIEVENRHYFDEATAHKKGVLLITAHFGNWELMGRYVTTCLGYDLRVVARDADDNETTDLVNELRKKSGYDVLSRGNAARSILSALKKNYLVAILPDQNAGDVFVPFFGQPCGSVTGPAVLHLRTGAPLLPVFDVRLPDGRHRIEVKEPIIYTPTENYEADIEIIMSRIHAEIEAQVRRYPDQWLWLHDRWRAARERAKEPVHAG